MKISIDGEWYELDKWAPYHPGGEQILSRFDGADATDHFYSLHSEKAIAQLKKMRPVDIKEMPPAPTKYDLAFRELKAKLEADGWYHRSMALELALLLPVVAGVVWGTMYATTYPLLSIVVLGVAMQQAGWLGHDMTHARNSTYNDTLLRYVSGWINGFNRDWWSDKHNTHHVLTNHIGIDPDIHNQPFLFLWAPPKSVDHHLRKYQHLYFLPLYALLYVSWRSQSLQWAWARRDYKMLLFTLLPGYLWLASLPLVVSAGAVLLGGLLVALVVTMSHESEEMLTSREPSFVRNQFDTTRDILCSEPITEYLCGGMQYQLEHHLFPTMPRYYYPKIRPIVQDWAREVGLEYKSASVLGIARQHYATLRHNASVAAVEG
eukprot:m.6931 g.6931  ORF g.6931 m.6931 type:complete len:377 (+) comp4495_c0_seq1:53-1183(+)